MTPEKQKKILLTAATIAVILLGSWLIVKYLLMWVLPFLLAFLTARTIEPAVLLLQRRMRFRRGYAAAMCSTLALGIIVAAVTLIVVQLLPELEQVIINLPAYTSRLSELIDSFIGKIDGLFSPFPTVDGGENAALGWMLEQLSTLTASLSSKLLTWLGSLAGSAPGALMFILAYGVSVYFFSSQYPDIVAFILRQVPSRYHRHVYTIKSDLLSAAGHWLKAQLMLMGVTFLELLAGLLFLRVEYALSLALIIALIDALPMLGVGTVLVPWGIFSLLAGNSTLGLGLIILYAVIALVRSFLEPRLVGAQMGLNPAATLIAVYVGYRVMGFIGMILFPIILIMLKQLSDRSYLKLWK